MEQEKESQEKAPVVIELSGVRKVYPSQAGDVVALDGVDLTVRQGEIYGVIGMSGAGKSTLIRCINGLDRPTDGHILIDGANILTMSQRELLKTRRNVAMIFQHFHLLMQRTVLRNVCYPLEIGGAPRGRAMARALELLEIVGLSEKAKAYPAQLSGGQKQRVAIARALATDPKVLLCDEATSALDPMTTQSILALLQDINQRLGITIVLITHEMSVIRQICTRVAIMDGGKIVEKGRVERIFTQPQTKAAKRLVHGTLQTEALTGRHTVRIVFDDSNTREPVIANMILACGVPVNILSSNIQFVDGQQRGQMLIELPRDESAAQCALDYLRSQNLTIEEVDDRDNRQIVDHDA